uniref:Uncharacterized protein n=1 Tax=Alexandrium monilatum TaxID=311494 RepID=A0A7S4PXE3_9DINO
MSKQRTRSTGSSHTLSLERCELTLLQQGQWMSTRPASTRGGSQRPSASQRPEPMRSVGQWQETGESKIKPEMLPARSTAKCRAAKVPMERPMATSGPAGGHCRPCLSKTAGRARNSASASARTSASDGLPPDQPKPRKSTKNTCATPELTRSLKGEGLRTPGSRCATNDARSPLPPNRKSTAGGASGRMAD